LRVPRIVWAMAVVALPHSESATNRHINRDSRVSLNSPS
jgi:hypothetical protein